MDASSNVDIGILCSEGLGDTLIQMVLAHNLAENGYQVTFYSDYAFSLKDAIDGYRVDPFPKEYQVIDTLKSHHAFIFDEGAPHYKRYSKPMFNWVVENGIAYKMSSGRPEKTQISRSQLTSRFNDCFDASRRSKEILAFNQPIRQPSRGLKRNPIAVQVVWLLMHRIGLTNVTNETGFRLQGKAKRIHHSRVLIHPTSSDTKKNWSVNKYIQLAKWLERDGFKPVFTVSPAERHSWLELVRGQFEVPLFESIYELAVFYSESGWFIGNDSGNAHMASCVGVPTFQIFGRWRNSPSWRAGWAKNRVITATFPANLSRTNWQAGLTPEKVYRSFIAWYKLFNNKQQPHLITG